MPPDGAQRSNTEKKYSPRSAVRKAGLEMPTKATTDRMMSGSALRRTAEKMPAEMPSTMAMVRPVPINSAVGPMRSMTRGSTATPLRWIE